MIGKTTNTKIKHILKEISKAKGETIHIEIINSSRFIFTEHRNFRTFPYVYDLKIYTSALKSLSDKKRFQNMMRR